MLNQQVPAKKCLRFGKDLAEYVADPQCARGGDSQLLDNGFDSGAAEPNPGKIVGGDAVVFDSEVSAAKTEFGLVSVR